MRKPYLPNTDKYAKKQPLTLSLHNRLWIYKGNWQRIRSKDVGEGSKYGNAVETYLDKDCSNIGRDTACPGFLVYPLCLPTNFGTLDYIRPRPFHSSSCESAVRNDSVNERYYWQSRNEQQINK